MSCTELLECEDKKKRYLDGRGRRLYTRLRSNLRARVRLVCVNTRLAFPAHSRIAGDRESSAVW